MRARARRLGSSLGTLREAFRELGSNRLYKLLLGLTIVTVTEAISYAWIEVLLFTSDSPVLRNLWLFHHYTTYHLVLFVLVVAMVFGVAFFGAMLYVPGRFWRFLLLTGGDFVLWLMLEDEFFFIFSGSAHTPTDWSSQFLGAVPLFGSYIPVWYFLDVTATFLCWYFALKTPFREGVLSASSRQSVSAE